MLPGNVTIASGSENVGHAPEVWSGLAPSKAHSWKVVKQPASSYHTVTSQNAFTLPAGTFCAWF